MPLSIRSTMARLLLLLLYAMCLSACGGSNSTSSNSNSTSAQHLYVANGSEILQFALPIKNTSTPSVVLNPASPPAFALAVDSQGNVATADGSGNVAIYNAPLSSSSTPSATFKNGAFAFNSLMTFNASGDLFVAGEAGSIVESIFSCIRFLPAARPPR